MSETRRRHTFIQRLLLALVPWAANLAIRVIGPTLRLQLSLAPGSPAGPPHFPMIYCMWHRCVLASAYVFRNRALRVMISRSFDGELIARTVGRLGYVPVRGSSSRGGAGALLEFREQLKNGASVVFTADGPRGPRYVAKPGPVLLARDSGVPIIAFHVAIEDAWIVRSWDALIIPKPFSRGVIRAQAPIMVPADAEDGAPYLAELQRRLEAARDEAERLVASPRSSRFVPIR
ncbi:MAG TPA: lysophospholipid acyltransferase family protein [Terriglobales bacterium]|nr:lysophospholipid acyltransferase family protein [Terriglobales bacterium]